MTAPAETSRARNGVPLRTRWGVAAGDTGNALSFITINTWLLYYLVNVAGMAPVVAGSLFVAGRLVDAVLDPLVGDLVDRHVARVPRLRWVRLSTLPFGACFALLWLAPVLDGPSVLWALLGLVVYGILHTTTSMPMVSLTPTLARTYDERTSLAGWRVGSGILWALVAVSGPPTIVLATTGERELAASSPRGWLVMAVVYGVLMIVGYAVATRAIIEPPPAPWPTPPRLTRSVLKQVWDVPALHSVIALSVVLTVGVMLANATLPFFLESVVGMDAGQQALSLGAFFLLAVLALPLWSLAAQRLGKPRALTVGAVVYAGGLLMLAGLRPTPDQLPVLVLVIVVSGVGLSAVSILPLAMLPDCAEHVEDALGVRREGLLYALHGFATKVGGSLGVFASSIVASLVGYESGTSVQSEQTQLGLSIVMGPLAAALFVAGGLLAWRSPLTRATHDAVAARVTARREAAAAVLGSETTVAAPRPGPRRL